jgi:hypothetical protein
MLVAWKSFHVLAVTRVAIEIVALVMGKDEFSIPPRKA